jgi:hypothetical protein
MGSVSSASAPDWAGTSTPGRPTSNSPDVGPTQFIAKDLDQERTLAFLDAGLNFGVLNLVGEVGWQFGKDLNLSTTFEDNDPKDNRLFGSAGAQLHLLVELELGFEARQAPGLVVIPPLSARRS